MLNVETVLVYLAVSLQVGYIVSECTRRYMTNKAIKALESNVIVITENGKLRAIIEYACSQVDMDALINIEKRLHELELTAEQNKHASILDEV